MNKKLTSVFAIAAVLGCGIYLARAPLWDMIVEQLTDDMFVTADNDSFNPGLAIGQRFPQISALHDGNEIQSVEQFVGDKGMVFIANRSADW